MNLEEARQRLLVTSRSELEKLNKEINKKRLDLSVSVAVEGAYRHHGESPPWSYGVSGGPDEIRKYIVALNERRQKLLEEIQFIVTAAVPDSNIPTGFVENWNDKDAEELKRIITNQTTDLPERDAKTGQEESSRIQHPSELFGVGPVSGKDRAVETVIEPDPVKTFFTGG